MVGALKFLEGDRSADVVSNGRPPPPAVTPMWGMEAHLHDAQRAGKGWQHTSS